MLLRLAPEDAVHEPLLAVLAVVLAIQVQRLEHGVGQVLLLQVPTNIARVQWKTTGTVPTNESMQFGFSANQNVFDKVQKTFLARSGVKAIAGAPACNARQGPARLSEELTLPAKGE